MRDEKKHLLLTLIILRIIKEFPQMNSNCPLESPQLSVSLNLGATLLFLKHSLVAGRVFKDKIA